ncbi:MAG TPA: pyridoxamine 5'-phosphate oxidase family protein [Gaiellaceae bacterium]|nr:pyridoxamine 5'-phosphate oxidase family protein [Gaiellaceae bacterium]
MSSIRTLYRRTITVPTPSARLEGSNILRHQVVRELVSARIVCVLATFDEASIHAVPMWFAQDDDGLALATGSASRKIRNLERDPRATLVLHDSRPGYEVCGVSMTGTAEIVRGKHAQRLIELVHRRYVTGAGEKLPAVAEFLRSDDTALRFTPLRALTWDERESDACKALRTTGGAFPLEPTTPR